MDEKEELRISDQNLGHRMLEKKMFVNGINSCKYATGVQKYSSKREWKLYLMCMNKYFNMDTVKCVLSERRKVVHF